MTAYESIKNKLSATEIYDIKQGGLIDAEIRAYAVALQVVYDKVDVLLRECFVQTAESYGLEQLESMARTYMNGDTLEIRRNKLINRLQINPSIIGKDALKKQVASLGLECNITENIADSKIYVDILTEVAYEAKDFRTMQFLDWFVKEQGEEETNAKNLISKIELFGSDPKSLYMLNQELAARVYSAPSLVL